MHSGRITKKNNNVLMSVEDVKSGTIATLPRAVGSITKPKGIFDRGAPKNPVRVCRPVKIYVSYFYVVH